MKQDGRCPVQVGYDGRGKVSYGSRKEAKRAQMGLAKFKRGSTERLAKKIYPCGDCGGWHLARRKRNPSGAREAA